MAGNSIPAALPDSDKRASPTGHPRLCFRKTAMKEILIIHNPLHGTNETAKQLAQSGFMVQPIDVEALDLHKLDPFQFDMAVINLYPNISLSWHTYMDFKKHFPKFPVLVQMRPEAANKLIRVVENIHRLGGSGDAAF